MRQYLYISTACGLDDDAVAAILDACEHNNKQRNVTGLLLYNGRNFMQLLEGEAADLFHVMRKIGGDTRHTGVSRLADIAIEERVCPDWLMRHIKLAEDVDQRRSSLEQELPDGLDEKIRELILNFAALN